MRVRAHAKINLYLRVIGPRPDGYHEVETILHGIDLADYIEFRRSLGDVFSLEVKEAAETVGPLPSIEENIVRTAAELLKQSLGWPLGADVKVGKRIPVGAGLGGGSSDAAAALIGLARLHDLELGKGRQIEIATRLGADVPFFLNGGTALATGMGEVIRALPDTQRLWFVLGMSRRPLLTRDVYRAWDDIGPTEGVPVQQMFDALGTDSPAEIAGAMRNDLQAAALTLRPELSAAIDAMESAGALRVIVSGSGPTIVGLCEGPDHARSLGAAIREVFDHTQVTCSQPRAIEILDPPE